MISRNAIACCLVAACGGPVRVELDARPSDASPDTLGTSLGDPPPDAVALTVMLLGIPAVGVPVYFQNADSSLVLATRTDTRGIAWANLAAGGFVTALEPADGTGATPITTFAAAQPADRLRLDLVPQVAPPLISVNLQIPLAAGAASYTVHNSCGDAIGVPTNNASAPLLDCGNGTIDLVVEPLDGDGNATFGALYAPGVSVIDGATTTVVGAYQPLAAASFTYRRVPSTVGWLGTYRAIITPRGRAFDASTGDAAASVVTDAVLLPVTAPDATLLTVTDAQPVATELGEQMVYDWRPMSPSYDLDLTSNRLESFASLPTYDPATHAIIWTERPNSVAATFVSARLHVSRDDVTSARSWTWRIAAPKSGVMVVLPKLATEGFDFNPGTTDSTAVDGLTAALVPGGYAAIRNRAFAPLTSAITGTSGQLIVQTQYTPEI